MKLKHFLFAVCLLVVTVRSATIPEKDIPVKVLYDENPSVKKAIPVEDPAVENFASIKNLDEKTQLSQEELADSLKHLPDVMQDASDSIEDELKKVSAEVAPPLEGSELLLLRRAEEIITAGLKTMKLNIQANKGLGATPSENDWKNLNTNVEEFFEEQRSNIKQDAGSGGGGGGGGDGGQNQIVQNIINTFQQATTNFIQNFQQQNKQNGTEDETSSQPPNLAQNFVNYFTGGVQQVVNNIQNNLNQNNNGAGNNSTTLGDTGVSSERPNNIFANVINTIQQAIQGNNQGSPTQIAGIGGNQSDTGTTQPDNNGNFFQTSFNQINQVIQGFRPQAGQQQQQQNSQSVQGDEGATTTQRTPIQVIQQIGSSIGNAINNANPFNGQSTKPPNSEDEGTGGTQQPVNFFQNIGNVIQGAIRPQQQASTQAPQGGGAASSGGSSNPIQAGIASGAAVGNQIQQLVGGQSGSNPVQSIQNAVAGAAGGSSTEKAKLEDAAEAKPSEPSKLK